ncbi:MAG: signal peptidase II [Pirellulales bacterium]
MDSTCGNHDSSSTSDSLSTGTCLNSNLKIPVDRHVLFWALAVVGCSADLVTKHWAFAAPGLQGGAVWWLWEGHAGFQQSLNEGALFGIGQGQAGWFALFALIALIGIPVWLFRFGAAHDRWLVITLGCIVGGVLGNLYDRLGWHDLRWEQLNPTRSGPIYAVRDWILWCWDFDQGIVWPNFNIADSLLVGGAISLMLHAYLDKKKDTTPGAVRRPPGR